MDLAFIEASTRAERRYRYMLAERQGPAGGLGPAQARLAAGGPASNARIAILSTPRSGNTYLRVLLANAAGLHQLSAHHPADIEWQHLPESVVIQLHWPRTEYLCSLLESAGVAAMTVVRHPFDVLVSVLRFAQTEPDTIEWLWGEGGDEERLVDADPTSEAFARWATGPRAEALLAVSDSWLDDPACMTVRYEELVSAPAAVASRILQAHCLKAVMPLEEAIAASAPERVNALLGLRHSWRAHPGTWEQLMPESLVRRLEPIHRERLRRLGYPSAVGGVGEDEARRRWKQLYEKAADGWPDSTYRAQVAVVDPPERVDRSSGFFALVKVHNQGSARWPGRRRHPQIHLGWRWLAAGAAAGEAKVEEGRCLLAKSLGPGQACYQAVGFDTPAATGIYILEVDLVHEGVRWFGVGPRLEMEVVG
jgi:hypothetical protein